MASSTRCRISSSLIPPSAFVDPTCPVTATESDPLAAESPSPDSEGSAAPVFPPPVLASVKPAAPPVTLSDCVPRPNAAARLPSDAPAPAASACAARDASCMLNTAVCWLASAVMRTSFVASANAASSALTT